MFNVLGPLINPANPNGMVLGIAERELGMTFAKSLRDGGVERALVVCGFERLDEISCAGNTYAWELSNGKITEQILHPSLFGLEAHPLPHVVGGSPQENAETTVKLLTSGRAGVEGKEMNAIQDFVLMNASALLVVSGLAGNYKEGVTLARESIQSGKAWDALNTFKEVGRNVAA